MESKWRLTEIEFACRGRFSEFNQGGRHARLFRIRRNALFSSAQVSAERDSRPRPAWRRERGSSAEISICRKSWAGTISAPVDQAAAFKACCLKSGPASIIMLVVWVCMWTEDLRRLSFLLSDLQTSHLQLITGTPWEVPVPRKFIFKNSRFKFLHL